jgi:peptidoglycan/xylan/chitin deacetylase (PgdA/CDA1 family)
MELMALGFAAVVAGCGVTSGPKPAARLLSGPPSSGGAPRVPSTTTTVPVTTTTPGLPRIPDPNPGSPQVFWHSATPTQQIALTIDDGFCQPCVEAYVDFAQRTGIHITFNPNGIYQEYWNPFASVLEPLITAGQVQIANHTYTHADLTRLGSTGINDELERNDEWIRSTFGITTRPWYRPPYGYRNEWSDDAAAEFGYTHVLMWNGSFGDAALLTPSELMTQAQLWLKPGTIMLGHANHPTVINLLGQIQDLIASRQLDPVTLDEMFGTSRAAG